MVWLTKIARAMVRASAPEGCGVVIPAAFVLCLPLLSQAAEFSIRQIADDTLVNREPVISGTGLIAWYAYEKTEAGETKAEVFVYQDGSARALTKDAMERDAANMRPQVHSNSVVWQSTFLRGYEIATWQLRQVPPRDGSPPELPALYIPHAEPDGAGGSLGRQWFEGPSTNPVTLEDGTVVTNIPSRHRTPSGVNEICMWDGGEVSRITRDVRNDLAPGFWGRLIAWQTAKGWPFGWEIMIWADGTFNQLTTNFYYDMAPRVHGNQVTWYGWDGHDFEIFLYDHSKDATSQLTTNRFDDVSPQICDGVVVWEAYPAVEADVFMWKDGETRKLSDNIEDDVNPRVWKGQVVWQGFDGDDFEIYLFDGEKAVKLTSNIYDDLNPDINDGLICWMGYHDNWDAEIFVWDGTATRQLTENDYEDRDPRTAGGRVVWQADEEGKSQVFLAEPK